jgi:UDP-glucuronate 4-epimerase
MRSLITGAAGFIGSHLADALLSTGNEVIGVDCITDYYDPENKRRNLRYLAGRHGWLFLEKRASEISLADLDGVEVVFHLAAQPGVRSSWVEFDKYVDLNLSETNALAESVVQAGVQTVVFASSSSVYGDLSRYPATESDQTRPRSPYGVTKLAGEKLWDAYVIANPMRVAALRFFTVYGPGQRPDMATQRLIRAALDGGTFTLFGDGEQRRDFTFINDVVNACIGVAQCPDLSSEHVVPLNVGGSGDVSMRQLVSLVEASAGKPIDIEWAAAQVGDVRRTGADISTIQKLTGWSPSTTIEAGVSMHVAFEKSPSLQTWRGLGH